MAQALALATHRASRRCTMTSINDQESTKYAAHTILAQAICNWVDQNQDRRPEALAVVLHPSLRMRLNRESDCYNPHIMLLKDAVLPTVITRAWDIQRRLFGRLYMIVNHHMLNRETVLVTGLETVPARFYKYLYEFPLCVNRS